MQKLKEVNLLPWREQARIKARQQFIFLYWCSMGSILMLILLWHFSIVNRIEHQQVRNHLLTLSLQLLNTEKQQISTLAKQRNGLLQTISNIHILDKSRTQIVRLFIGLSAMMPENILLTRIQIASGNILLMGRSESNINVSKLVHNLKQSNWMNPVLKEIRKGAEGVVFQITLQRENKNAINNFD